MVLVFIKSGYAFYVMDYGINFGPFKTISEGINHLLTKQYYHTGIIKSFVTQDIDWEIVEKS